MKSIGVDELFNRRVIISELEASFNDDDAIDLSGIIGEKLETPVVSEVLIKKDIPVGEVGEEVKATVIPEKYFK